MLVDSDRINLFFSEKVPLISILLKGLGQIMLQENVITGLLFLIGLSIGSHTMAIAAIVSVVSGNIVAVLLKYDKKEIKSGLYGFSPALVGVALILFYKPQAIVWCSIVVGSMLAAILQHFFILKKIPAFTLPFVLVTWAALYLFNNLYIIEPSMVLKDNDEIINKYMFAFRGIGQVIFQEKTIIGVVFFIGILIASPIKAAFAITASIISGLVAIFLFMPIDSIYMGLFSFNAVLCAIVFASKNTNGIFFAALSVMLSLIISVLMFKLNLTQLTFPFVAASATIIVIENRLKKN